MILIEYGNSTYTITEFTYQQIRSLADGDHPFDMELILDKLIEGKNLSIPEKADLH
jgi:hypothetical protein